MMMPRSAITLWTAVLVGWLVRAELLHCTPVPAVVTSTTANNIAGTNGNGHEDHWHSLTDTQQAILLHAYFTSAMPADIKSCERGEECPLSMRCDQTWKICVPKESPHFPATDGMCGKHHDCKPMYHCAHSKCLLTGPLACKALEDCLTIPGMHFDCVEVPEQLPGRRCWRKCQMSRDCMECEDAQLLADLSLVSTCRIPLPFRNSVVCKDNYCKKKLPGEDQTS